MDNSKKIIIGRGRLRGPRSQYFVYITVCAAEPPFATLLALNYLMAHNRNDSLDSLSSLTSISSRTSIETYESLKEEITDVEQSLIDLQELVDAAEKVLNEKFAPEPQSTYTYKKESETISVNLTAVMSTMLACAEECGGESGKRYVASAIVACSRKGGHGDVVEALAALGTTWLTHLLFICQFCCLVMNKKSDIFLSQNEQEPRNAA